MGNIKIGVNMEFVRSADMSFDKGIQVAADIGYEYVEPMVHNGRELLSEAGYFHSVSLEEDPLLMKKICDDAGVKISGLSAHCPLMRPEISVPYLKQAIRSCAEMGVLIVNTDEGVKPDWMTDEQAFSVMEYTLTQVCMTAERYGVYIGIEDHQIYTKTAEGLMKIANLVDSPYLQVNYDCGNAFIAGSDPYEMLDVCKDRLWHLHAKDIGGALLDEVGTVTGTPVGCACGEGAIDWKRIIDVVKTVPRDIVFSVECGTIDQAKFSYDYLTDLI